MGIENMRRMYVVFAAGILLITLVSLLNSWSMETELRNRVTDVGAQLQECSKQQTSCMEESLSLLEQRDSYVIKVKDLDAINLKLNEDIKDYKNKITKSETQVNRTLVDVEFCKAELQSLKNLQVSRSATLETIRLEKDTLTTQLADKKQKIQDLEKEIERLKAALTTKSVPNPVPSKVTPAAQPPKLSPSLNANNPIDEPVLDNDAKEEIEDTNALNDANEFEPHLK